MPHRDDHDAALARADALQRELDQERAADADDAERVARLENELAQARERLGRAEEELSRLRPRRSPAKRPPPPQGPLAQVAPRPAPEADASPDAGERPNVTAIVMVAIGVLLFMVSLSAVARCDGEARHDQVGAGTTGSSPNVPNEPEVPAAPPTADALLQEGLARLPGDVDVRSISIDYVRPDGTLDPTHGRITIDSERPPRPPPPDDPSRPTGAPPPSAGRHMMMMDCPAPTWTRTTGWQVGTGTCFSVGAERHGPPRCSPSEIMARAQALGAPDGLATISTTLSIDVESDVLWQRIWTFSIRDDLRGVQFEQKFRDRECDAPVSP